jgi:hypothetical protein
LQTIFQFSLLLLQSELEVFLTEPWKKSGESQTAENAPVSFLFNFLFWFEWWLLKLLVQVGNLGKLVWI